MRYAKGILCAPAAVSPSSPSADAVGPLCVLPKLSARECGEAALTDTHLRIAERATVSRAPRSV